MRQKTQNKENKHKAKRSKYIKRPSLKFKLFAYLGALCLFTVSVLWIFQVVLLDEFYYHITLTSLKDTAQGYAGLSDEDITSRVDFTSTGTNVSIIVCTPTGEEIARSGEHPDNLIRHLGIEMRKNLYNKAKSNGGEYIHTFDFSDIAVEHPTDKDKLPPQNDDSMIQPREQNSSPTDTDVNASENNADTSIGAKRLVYTKIIRTDNGADRLILLDCSLTPVSTVIETVKIQLIIVSVLCVLFSLCIALVFSYRISRPISKINESAKQLALGKYDVRFDGGGCREIDELSYTLEYTAEELSKLENMQNELISNISHDLRTPLTMIGGYAEVMRDIPGENSPENVQVIIDETKRLTSLVNNLLEVSRMQRDAKHLELEQFSLTELMKETVSRFEKLNENKGYIITLDAPEEAFVYADKEKISQVLYNLIGNAINYTGEDKRVYLRQTTSDSIVKVEVCDTGEGIEADKLPQIWERYYRADKYHRRSEVGMGIGLSIVKDILEAHNAAFGVSSKLGHGSVFWFKLHTK